ncbi:MAG: gamma-glutamylcyclotransferase family protein [Hyphomicrobiaceae bacterium]
MSAAATDAPAYLFVYGTLMTRTRGPLGASQRARLHREGTGLGAATIAGRLVALDAYPGLIEPAAPGDIVHGELFRLDQPVEVLSWLDSYEGVSPQPTAQGEYVRASTPARLATGEEFKAWVYRYCGATFGLPTIPSGRWDG